MTEAEFQSSYSIWKRYNYRKTCGEELKVCKEKHFNFDKIEPHQLLHLHNVKHDFFQHKIPDLGCQNPFDSFSLCGEPAWLVILWYKPRKPKVFYMIDVDKIEEEIASGSKSLTEERAKELAKIIGELK